MRILSETHVRNVTNTIWSQLIHTTRADVIGSWALSSLFSTEIVEKVNGYDLAMAALVMQVDGLLFKGQVFIALDEGSDYYRIYFCRGNFLEEQRSDVSFDELGEILDSLIETGNMSKEEYKIRLMAEILNSTRSL